MAMSKANVSLKVKLLIDTKEQRVLFAEAGKDFVDFLFTILSLPVGSVIRLLSKNGMVGALGKLYESIENLSDTYLQSVLNKETLLNPKVVTNGGSLLLLNDSSSSSSASSSSSVRKQLYICPSLSNSDTYGQFSYGNATLHCYVADDPQTLCPQCNKFMSKPLTYVAPPAAPRGGSSSAGKGGYVKGVVTYMVMDDLEVKPMSTISGITMLNSFHVKDIADLQEKMVSVGMDEGLKLLKASLETRTVLTEVFLVKAKRRCVSQVGEGVRRSRRR